MEDSKLTREELAASSMGKLWKMCKDLKIPTSGKPKPMLIDAILATLWTASEPMPKPIPELPKFAKVSAPVGVGNAFDDEVPPAVPSLRLDITAEQIMLCYLAKANPSGNAVSSGGRTVADLVSGNVVRLSIPDDEGGHKRYLITLPACLTVTAVPADTAPLHEE